MAAVGLLYVGAVLFVNGLMLLGRISPRGAAPLNLFVGVLQVVTPTYLIVYAAGNPALIALAAGLYFFGFTYLWVGINSITGWPNEGLGWFSLVVTLSAAGFAVYSWQEVGDYAFTVLWIMWGILWFFFFLLMAGGRTALAPATGLLAIGSAVLTTGVPGFLLLAGWWRDSTALALVLALAGVLLVILSLVGGRVLSGPLPRSQTHQTAPAS